MTRFVVGHSAQGDAKNIYPQDRRFFLYVLFEGKNEGLCTLMTVVSLEDTRQFDPKSLLECIDEWFSSFDTFEETVLLYKDAMKRISRKYQPDVYEVLNFNIRLTRLNKDVFYGKIDPSKLFDFLSEHSPKNIIQLEDIRQQMSDVLWI